MNNPTIASGPRCTNVDVDRLAGGEVVRAFMVRVGDDYRNPLTGEMLVNSLAEATANAFGLFLDDGFTLPCILYDVAVNVARRG